MTSGKIHVCFGGPSGWTSFSWTASFSLRLQEFGLPMSVAQWSTRQTLDFQYPSGHHLGPQQQANRSLGIGGGAEKGAEDLFCPILMCHLLLMILYLLRALTVLSLLQLMPTNLPYLLQLLQFLRLHQSLPKLQIVLPHLMFLVVAVELLVMRSACLPLQMRIVGLSSVLGGGSEDLESQHHTLGCHLIFWPVEIQKYLHHTAPAPAKSTNRSPISSRTWAMTSVT